MPYLRRHGGKKLGVVTLSGVDHYLGPWPDGMADAPPAVRAAYDREIAAWLSRGRTPDPKRVKAKAPPPDAKEEAAGLTVAELVERWLAWAKVHYRDGAGERTSELGNYTAPLRALLHLFTDLAVAAFSPLKLKACRELFITGYVHPRYGEQGTYCRK